MFIRTHLRHTLGQHPKKDNVNFGFSVANPFWIPQLVMLAFAHYTLMFIIDVLVEANPQCLEKLTSCSLEPIEMCTVKMLHSEKHNLLFHHQGWFPMSFSQAKGTDWPLTCAAWN